MGAQTYSFAHTHIQKVVEEILEVLPGDMVKKIRNSKGKVQPRKGQYKERKEIKDKPLR